MPHRLFLFMAVASLFAPGVRAGQVRIVTWNVKDIFSEDDVQDRKDDLKAMADALKPDILCIQEITSERIARKIAEAMNLDGFHVACSDFVQSDGANRNAFEVAIISKFPFAQVLEFDQSPDNREEEDDPDELPLTPLKKIGIQDVNASRGYLWARIDPVKLTIAVVHLKSSQGRVGSSDRGNAEKREIVAAAVAAGVVEDKDFFPGYSFMVLGDFNVGHSDAAKNGKNLAIDCFSDCNGTDGYDETHALLSSELVSNLKMKNLTLSITDSTFPDFPGSPIDNIYVDGTFGGNFAAAQKASSKFGSDHLPVFTVLTTP